MRRRHLALLLQLQLLLLLLQLALLLLPLAITVPLLLRLLLVLVLLLVLQRLKTVHLVSGWECQEGRSEQGRYPQRPGGELPHTVTCRQACRGSMNTKLNRSEFICILSN